MTVIYNDEKIEADRLTALEDMPKDAEPDGEFAVHEAMDRASILIDMVESVLLNHQTIVARPEFYHPACKIHTMLFNLYQEIGALRFDIETPIEEDKAE